MECTKFQKQILDRLENFVQEQGSQTKASKILGFSTSTISTAISYNCERRYGD